ncbi:hypothetical protein [Paraburkholderia youngii]|uniref:hypothetical protein n=1 Tax=Paraburkholderia youngii TaxID=2782701 RepID=UPI003D1C80D7
MQKLVSVLGNQHRRQQSRGRDTLVDDGHGHRRLFPDSGDLSLVLHERSISGDKWATNVPAQTAALAEVFTQPVRHVLASIAAVPTAEFSAR